MHAANFDLAASGDEPVLAIFEGRNSEFGISRRALVPQ